MVNIILFQNIMTSNPEAFIFLSQVLYFILLRLLITLGLIQIISFVKSDIEITTFLKDKLLPYILIPFIIISHFMTPDTIAMVIWIIIYGVSTGLIIFMFLFTLSIENKNMFFGLFSLMIFYKISV